MEKLQNDVKKPSLYYMKADLIVFLTLILGFKALTSLLNEDSVTFLAFVTKRPGLVTVQPYSLRFK